MTIFRQLANVPWQALPDWLSGNRLRILMYHSISENQRDPYAISPKEFERQMKILQTQSVISLAEGSKLLSSDQCLKNKWVITFDDGLLDFFNSALPILRDFDYPVTMFLPVGLTGKTSAWDSYDKHKPLMDWAQVESCQQWKVTFGSHTVNHVRLTECSEIQLQEECQESLQILENRLTNTIRALAYPGGYHNQIVHLVAQNAGYICGLGAASRWGNGKDTDVYQLRRERMSR
jgi:peptidoglycan/xylan/chitin deacetylase (PgdA/CDA1 family)